MASDKENTESKAAETPKVETPPSRDGGKPEAKPAPAKVKEPAEPKPAKKKAVRPVSKLKKAEPVKEEPMKRAFITGRAGFPGIDIPDGKGGYVTVTREPRLVAVAVADALLKVVRPGNPYGLTPDDVVVDDDLDLVGRRVRL